MRWVWIPKKSIGNLELNKPISLECAANFRKVDDYGYQSVYELSGEKVRLTIEDGLIISVELFGSVIYESQEIIGMDIIQLNRVIDLTSCIYKDHKELGKEIYCDALGAIFWEENNLIESVTVW